jgi:hypothetical protein
MPSTPEERRQLHNKQNTTNIILVLVGMVIAIPVLLYLNRYVFFLDIVIYSVVVSGVTALVGLIVSRK